MNRVKNFHLKHDSKLVIVTNRKKSGIAVKGDENNILFLLKSNYIFLEELSMVGDDSNKIYLTGILKDNGMYLVTKICIDLVNRCSFEDYLNVYEDLKVIGDGLYLVKYDGKLGVVSANEGCLIRVEEDIKNAFIKSLVSVTGIGLRGIKSCGSKSSKYLELIINFENLERLHTVLRISSKGYDAYNIVYSEAYNGTSFPISSYLVKGDCITKDVFLFCLSKHPIIKELEKVNEDKRVSVGEKIRKRILRAVGNKKNTYLDISFI